MFKSLTKIFGGSTEQAIKKLSPIVEQINTLEPVFESISDEELGSKTKHYKARLQSGEKLDSLLPEAFATVREAAKRTLGQRHFDVQLIGGITLHQGKISEMKTGEGKTLVATLAAYLNALGGEGTHVVTVNDYLARRDAQWMGAIYNMLGLSVGVLQHDEAYLYEPSDNSNDHSKGNLRQANRQDAYLAEITYGTNNEFGFDYLRDNMVIHQSQRVQRPLKYAIVDEVDNILIDEARTPLIISGPAEESGKEYQRFSRLAPSLQQDIDYTIEEKYRAASLTADGMSKIEKSLNVENLYDPENASLVHYAENALKAHVLFQRDKEYVVNNKEVVIVDEFTGRLMPGRRFSDGIHQALEAKEKVPIQRESITYATITLQNYFRLYSKLAGMTGTAATEAEEFWKIYKLEVLEIPTNLPMKRIEMTDFIYRDQKAKYKAIVADIEEKRKTGQPVLVGTTDISTSEVLSDMLTKRNVPHQVLNAKQHEKEASIIAEAGRLGSVTVATNMAGRGTDIVLGGNPETLDISQQEWKDDHKKIVDLGGLHIIGSERHEARRIDNQLRGRSGRQGDPGDSRFYVALDDELMKRFGGDRIRTVMEWAGLEENASIENRMVSKSIEGAQIKVEAYHFDIRKHLVDYDDVVNTHRTIIYKERGKIIEDTNLKANVQSMIEQELLETLERYIGDLPPEQWEVDNLVNELESIFPLEEGLADATRLGQMDSDEIRSELLQYAKNLYENQESNITYPEMRSIERELML